MFATVITDANRRTKSQRSERHSKDVRAIKSTLEHPQRCCRLEESLRALRACLGALFRYTEHKLSLDVFASHKPPLMLEARGWKLKLGSNRPASFSCRFFLSPSGSILGKSSSVFSILTTATNLSQQPKPHRAASCPFLAAFLPRRTLDQRR